MAAPVALVSGVTAALLPAPVHTDAAAALREPDGLGSEQAGFGEAGGDASSWRLLLETLTVAPVVVDLPDAPLALSALVADTDQTRTQGLSGVQQLPARFAMLFVLDEPADHGGFWMKGTRIPLDVVFLAGDLGQGREVAAHVLAVVPMVPCTADPCPVYTAPGPYLAALEVPSGTLSALQPGTRVWFVRPESGR